MLPENVFKLVIEVTVNELIQAGAGIFTGIVQAIRVRMFKYTCKWVILQGL